MIPPGFGTREKYANVVLEGVDCSGKSSIARAMVRMSPDFSRVVHYSNPKSKEEGEATFRRAVAEMNSDSGVVYDRAQVGERVYAPPFRGYYPEYMDDLDRTVHKRTLFVLVTASLPVLVKRFDGQFITEDQLGPLSESFFSEFYRAPLKSKTVLDTSLVTADQAAWLLLCVLGARSYA